MLYRLAMIALPVKLLMRRVTTMTEDIWSIAKDILEDQLDVARGDEETFENEDQFMDYAFGAYELDNTIPGYESHEEALKVLCYDRVFVGQRLAELGWPKNPFENPTGTLVFLVRDVAEQIVYAGHVDLDDVITGPQDEE